MSSYRVQQTLSKSEMDSDDAVTINSQFSEQSIHSSFFGISTEVRISPQKRVFQLLLDYKQFKSARNIQRHVRGWLCRLQVTKRAAAVTTISRWWRGFSVRKSYYSLVEQRLQANMLAHYHEQATMIQTLFRGWRTRQFVQDFNGLQLLQLQFAEDLISCLARHLRHLKHNNQLPGLYSMRENGCLSIIEDLARTFSYRFHNGQVRASIAKRRSYLEDMRRDFNRSEQYTITPYPGHGAVLGECTVHVELNEPGLSKETDIRVQRLILMFEKSKRDPEIARIQASLASKLRRDIESSLKVQQEEKMKKFCNHVFHRIAPELKTKDNRHGIKMYLEELLYNAEEPNCHCRPKLVDNSLCH